MRVKPRVFDGDESVLKVFRDFVDGDHDAILGTFIVGDHIAVRVVEKRGFGLVVDDGEVELGRGFRIRLDDAQHRSARGHADDQREQREKAHRAHQRADEEIRLAVSGLEDASFAYRRIDSIFFAHARLP